MSERKGSDASTSGPRVLDPTARPKGVVNMQRKKETQPRRPRTDLVLQRVNDARFALGARGRPMVRLPKLTAADADYSDPLAKALSVNDKVRISPSAAIFRSAQDAEAVAEVWGTHAAPHRFNSYRVELPKPLKRWVLFYDEELDIESLVAV